MHVLVAAVAFSSGPSGVQRHALNLVRSLLTRRNIDCITLVIAPWQQAVVESANLPRTTRFKVYHATLEASTYARNTWYYLRLPALAHHLHADIVHYAYPAPLDREAFACPVVVSLHDLYPYEIPANFGHLKGIFNRLVLQQCLRNASAIACVSDATYLALGRYVPLAVRQRALRIYNCVPPAPPHEHPEPVQPLEDLPFLLSIAQHRANKNIPFLLHTFALMIREGHLDAHTRLAVIGINGPETRRILDTIRAQKLQQRIILLTSLTDSQITWCYHNCLAVLAPSTHEGFGLPVAEALIAGARVVCSDIPAFRESGTWHCTYVHLHAHPEPEQAFAQGILDALDQPTPDPVRMPDLAPAAIAPEYAALYQRLLAIPPPAARLYPASRPQSPRPQRKVL